MSKEVGVIRSDKLQTQKCKHKCNEPVLFTESYIIFDGEAGLKLAASCFKPFFLCMFSFYSFFQLNAHLFWLYSQPCWTSNGRAFYWSKGTSCSKHRTSCSRITIWIRRSTKTAFSSLLLENKVTVRPEYVISTFLWNNKLFSCLQQFQLGLIESQESAALQFQLPHCKN